MQPTSLTQSTSRPDEFATTPLPSHLTIYTWPNCTLTELTHHVAAAASSASLPLLPEPAIGTRLAYRLIFADTRGTSNAPGAGGFQTHSRYVAKDIGSVVIGEGGPTLGPNDIEKAKARSDGAAAPDGIGSNSDHSKEDKDKEEKDKEHKADGDGDGNNDADKTLAEARFVPGDFVSCAILPPLPDGSVAPASDARTGRGVGVGEARPLVDSSGGSRERENGFPRAGDRGFYGGPRDERGSRNPRHNRGVGGGRGSVGGGNVPSGEWRRGERLPDVPAGSGSGSGSGRPRGRGRGRW